MASMITTDFTECLKPFQITLKLFGLETCQLIPQEVNGDGTRYSFKRSAAATTFCVLIGLSVFAAYVVNFYVTTYYANNSLPLTVITSYLISTSVSVSVALVSLISMLINHKKRLDVIHSFIEVDSIQIACSHDWYRKWSKRSTACILGVFTVPIGAVVVGLCSNTNIYSYFKIAEDLSNFVVLAVVLQYVNTVLLVRQRVQALNSELRGSTRLQRASQSRVHMAPSRVYGRLLAPGGSLQHTETICTMSAVYGKLHRITCLINSAYGWQVMFCILLCVSSLTTVLHFGMQLNFESSYAGQHENSAFAMTSVVLWTLFYTAETIAIIRVCSATRKEVSVTKNEIQRFLLTPGLDGRAVRALREFSQHISSREIEFSAAGFFNIDMTLLASMAWTVLSYLLVLIQFD
ncbi:putative gustatory receptor 2a [Bacillus rossius redtenbacheri]|uniref:putative gustatory receptor 2a n=1 Tax=Bacillus rossius redtenbacheri TaxID=93214 RepID=UPI002FDDD4E9